MVGIGATNTCAKVPKGLTAFFCPEMQWRTVCTAAVCGLCPESVALRGGMDLRRGRWAESSTETLCHGVGGSLESLSSEALARVEAGGSTESFGSTSTATATVDWNREFGEVVGGERQGMVVVNGYLVRRSWEKKRQQMMKKEMKKWVGKERWGRKLERRVEKWWIGFVERRGL